LIRDFYYFGFGSVQNEEYMISCGKHFQTLYFLVYNHKLL